MIKLFRKIRQQMINENKTSKYLKYAIGEIALVVIGILIALQLNTWNENRKAEIEETNILTALQTDFKVSKIRIEETMISQKRVLDFSNILIEIHEREDQKEFEYFDTHLDSISELLGYGMSWYRAEPVTGAYNALISAGKIDLIKNEEIRTLLAQFSADLESGFEDQQPAMDLLASLTNDISEFLLKIESNKFRKITSLSPRKKDTLVFAKKFFSNNAFFGKLYLKRVLERNRYYRQQSMLNQTNQILSLINNELEK